MNLIGEGIPDNLKAHLHYPVHVDRHFTPINMSYQLTCYTDQHVTLINMSHWSTCHTDQHVTMINMSHWSTCRTFHHINLDPLYSNRWVSAGLYLSYLHLAKNIDYEIKALESIQVITATIFQQTKLSI